MPSARIFASLPPLRIRPALPIEDQLPFSDLTCPSRTCPIFRQLACSSNPTCPAHRGHAPFFSSLPALRIRPAQHGLAPFFERGGENFLQSCLQNPCRLFVTTHHLRSHQFTVSPFFFNFFLMYSRYHLRTRLLPWRCGCTWTPRRGPPPSTWAPRPRPRPPRAQPRLDRARPLPLPHTRVGSSGRRHRRARSSSSAGDRLRL